MASDSLSVRPEALLQHRDFVAELARGLVQDLAGARAPRSAAWTQPGDPELQLGASLALQQQVVQVVLDLREPFRTVLLLHFYARLSIPKIAERRGDSGTSVRAQLERAIELVRERLDAECEGGRAAWTAGLAPLAGRERRPALVLRSLAIAAAGAAIAIPAYLWIHSRAAGRAVRSPPFAGLSTGTDTDPFQAGGTFSNESVRASLASKTVPELVQFAVQAQRTLRERLLEPDERLRRERAALLTMPSTGLARILHPGRLGAAESNLLGLGSGGSCFSFVTRGHAWEDEPDLLLQEGHFISVGEGPGVLDLGPIRLEDLPESESPPPAALNDAGLRAWPVFWGAAIDPEKGFRPYYREAVRQLQIGPATPTPGRTYLVRGLSPDRHDVLAAFEPLEEDAYGWTIAWRVLRIGPLPTTPAKRPDPYWWVPAPPTWHKGLGIEPLVEMLGDTRAVAHQRLFEPSDELRLRFGALLKRPGTNLARILAGDRYAALVEGGGSGQAFSFTKGSVVATDQADLVLDGASYSTRIERGACGVLLDFGVRPLDSVGTTRESMPNDLSPANREIWELLWTLRAADQGANGRAVSLLEESRVRQFVPVRTVPGRIGHTYLLRSIVAGEHDVLAAFSTVDRDEHGDWILWQRIQERDLKSAPKRK